MAAPVKSAHLKRITDPEHDARVEKPKRAEEKKTVVKNPPPPSKTAEEKSRTELIRARRPGRTWWRYSKRGDVLSAVKGEATAKQKQLTWEGKEKSS